MKEFVTTLYDYEYTGMKEDESEDEDSDDENVIEVKLNDGEQKDKQAPDKLRLN